MKLADKVAIITGAGSGIGRSMAYLFAKEGAAIAVADINAEGGEKTAIDINKNGGRAEFIPTNVSMASDVENLVKTTMEKFGRIDILINNAGIFMEGTPIEDTDEALWNRIYDVNVKSMFFTVKYVVPQMKKGGGGVIVNTGSASINRPLPGFAPYISSKGAVNTLTRVLAKELAPSKIRVNCINPAPTDTPMIKMIPPEARAEIVKSLPLQRMAQPQDLANAALYLASEDSALVTGTCLNVDAGDGL